MMRPNIIITHGLGDHPTYWYKNLEKQILKRINANIIPFYYHDLIQPNQEEKFKHYKHLKNRAIRKFIFQNVADGVTYNQPEIYAQVHEKLRFIMDSLNDEPTVIIAPSLGGQVILDHIWDGQRGLEGQKPLLDLFITNGCNIPLFSSGLKEIAHINQNFRWLNYYDPADVLGYPLSPLGYEAEDIEINTHFGLLSHLRYWHNKKFVESICKEISTL